MNGIELKPCPFCGSEDVAFTCLEDVSYVECWDCSAKVETYNGIEDAVKKWNRRAINRDELLKIVYDLEHLDIDSDSFPHWNKDIADDIRKAVGGGCVCRG